MNSMTPNIFLYGDLKNPVHCKENLFQLSGLIIMLHFSPLFNSVLVRKSLSKSNAEAGAGMEAGCAHPVTIETGSWFTKTGQGEYKKTPQNQDAYPIVGEG